MNGDRADDPIAIADRIAVDLESARDGSAGTSGRALVAACDWREMAASAAPGRAEVYFRERTALAQQRGGLEIWSVQCGFDEHGELVEINGDETRQVACRVGSLVEWQTLEFGIERVVGLRRYVYDGGRLLSATECEDDDVSDALRVHHERYEGTPVDRICTWTTIGRPGAWDPIWEQTFLCQHDRSGNLLSIRTADGFTVYVRPQIERLPSDTAAITAMTDAIVATVEGCAPRLPGLWCLLLRSLALDGSDAFWPTLRAATAAHRDAVLAGDASIWQLWDPEVLPTVGDGDLVYTTAQQQVIERYANAAVVAGVPEAPLHVAMAAARQLNQREWRPHDADPSFFVVVADRAMDDLHTNLRALVTASRYQTLQRNGLLP